MRAYELHGVNDLRREDIEKPEIPSGWVLVQVKASGICSSDIPRIFEKGYTGCNGRQEMKSSGLGLYLCSRAAKKISVEIDVDSEPGRGTVFSLKLPEQIKILD